MVEVMIERYGKDLDMRMLRSMETEIQLNKMCQENCAKYHFNPKQESKKCRICGSEQIKLFHKGYRGFTYYECEDCKALFLSTLPKLNEMYREKGCNAPYYIDDSTFEKRVEIIQRPKVEFILDACKENAIAVRKWVDVGSGGGNFSIV